MGVTRGGTGWERLFWRVFEQSKLPIALVDDERRIVDANEAAVSLWGGSHDELVGRSIVDSIEPAERPAAAREWQEFTHSGDYSGTRELLRADGAVVSVTFAARRATVDGRQLAVYVAMGEGENGSDGPRAGGELPLTDREREVITLIALGYETDQIASELHISSETVRSHVRNAMSKLDVHTRAQLVAVTLCADKALHEDMLRRDRKSSV
jgi:PAS domain S-box-containing protein